MYNRILKTFFFLNIVVMGACTQDSHLLMLKPSGANSSDLSIHQQHPKFPLKIWFVVESSRDMTSHKELWTWHIEYFLKSLLLQKQVIDFHIQWTLASSDPEIASDVVGSNVFTHENLDNMFQENQLQLESLQNILSLESLNNDFLGATLRLLDTNQQKDQSHLLIVFVGGDSLNNLSLIDNFSEKLLAFQSNQKNKITLLSLQPLLTNCSTFRRSNENSLSEFIGVLDGATIFLCDSGTESLLQAAQFVYQRVALIPFTRLPVIETAQLCYGPDLISQHALEGWSYVPEDNQVALAWNVKLSSTDEESSQKSQAEENREDPLKTSYCKENNPQKNAFYLNYMSVTPDQTVETFDNR